MKKLDLKLKLIIFGLFVLLAPLAIPGQGQPEPFKNVQQRDKVQQTDVIQQRFAPMRSFLDRLPDNKRAAFSGSAQNLFHMVESSQPGKGFLDSPLRSGFSPGNIASPALKSDIAAGFAVQDGLIPVSDPGNDFVFSVLSGFTQSETSTAWCGDNVVVGFNDTGSIFETLVLNPPQGLSNNGVTRSSDGGATWSSPVRVNTNREPLRSGKGTDQFMPGLAVDRTRKIAACFYDRREDPDNFFIDRFCAVSQNAGATWTDEKQTSNSFAPIHGTDVPTVIPTYMGDYDTVASDFTGANRGFVGSFQIITPGGNPDVKATRFR
ncbi:MAG: glycoside hydrolase [Acidobacteriia bacterium]|nr:glycoside hydrolase [Terriglobia bacterium]